MKSKNSSTIVITALSCVLLAAIVVAILFRVDSVNKQNNLYATISQQNATITELNSAINDLSQTVTVYRTTRDVKSGEILESADIESIQVGLNLANEYNTKLEDLVGKAALYDFGKHIVVYDSMVYPVTLKSDYRTLDVLCDRQPIGFTKGDTIDVRITFPNGQDFLLLSKKLVSDVYGNAVRIIVDEKDILIYKSAEADWARFYKTGTPGSSVQIYCTTYVAAGVQAATKQYYPIQTKLPDKETTEGSTLWIALNNYNLTEADLNDWLQVDRMEFENALTAYDYYWNDNITYEATYMERTKDLEDLLIWDGATEYTATFDCFVGDDVAFDKNIEYAFGKEALRADNKSTKLVINEIDKNFMYDQKGGADAVNKAKIIRDNMYITANNAFAERRMAMIEARLAEKTAYEEKLAHGLVSEPWNNDMFDERKWEEDYSSGVLDLVKAKEDEEKEKQEAAKHDTSSGSVIMQED